MTEGGFRPPARTPESPLESAVARRSVVIVGATSAIAECLAATYAADGARLVLAARNPDALGAIAQDLRIRYSAVVEEVTMDATSQDSISAAARTLAAGAPPDVLIFAIGSNAGPGAAGNVSEINRVTLVNYGVVTAVVAALLPGLASRPGAAIAVISSVAGDRGRKSNFIYGAAKAALNSYAQGLRGLLHPQVSVTTVKLGYVDTRMSYGMSPPLLTVSPERASRAIVRAIARRKDVVYVPLFWWPVMLVLRLIPEWVFKRLTLP